MAEITSREYWAEMKAIAKRAIDEVTAARGEPPEDDEEDREMLFESIQEQITNHEWVTFLNHSYNVLRFASNKGDEVMEDNMDGTTIGTDRGTESWFNVITGAAWWAMMGDAMGIVYEQTGIALFPWEDE